MQLTIVAPEQLGEYEKELSEGDQTHVDSVILNYVPLVFTMVKRYPLSSEDMYSYCLEQLVRLFKNPPPLKNGFTSYVALVQHRIQGAILDYLRAEHNMFKHQRNGDSFFALSLDDETDDALEQLYMPTEEQDLTGLEINLYMGAMSLSERERTILNLRLEGYVDREIATKVNLSHERVRQVRCQLLKRFKHYAEENTSPTRLSL